jgi:hypothetical protein
VLDGGSRDLAGYLAEEVFAGSEAQVVGPDPDLVAGYAAYLDRYEAGLPAVRTAATSL